MIGRKLWMLGGTLVAATLAVVAVGVFAYPDRPKEQIEEGVRRAVAQAGVVIPDGPKAIIEGPVKQALANAAGNVTPKGGVTVAAKKQPLDVGKRQVEAKAEELLAKVTGPQASPASDNPKVEAGKVRWHKSLAEACEASRRSGKPVLLFHMMGDLDHQFC